MKNIYLVRHGESMSQIEEGVCGINPVLSLNGERQARSLKSRMQGIEAEVVYISPLIRAYRTFILSEFKPTKVKYDKRLIESEWSSSDGYSEQTFQNLPSIGELDNSCVSGLSFPDRVKSFYHDIVVNGDSSICVFSHYGTTEQIVRLFLNITEASDTTFRLDNTNISHLQIDKNGRKLVCGLNLHRIVLP